MADTLDEHDGDSLDEHDIGVRTKVSSPRWSTSSRAPPSSSRLAADLELALDDHDRTVAATAALTEDAALDQRTAQFAADSFRRRMPASAALRTAAAALKERYLALADLAAALATEPSPSG